MAANLETMVETLGCDQLSAELVSLVGEVLTFYMSGHRSVMFYL